MRALAMALGRLLARGHARTPGGDGQPGLAALRAAVAGKAAGLAEETATLIEAEAAAQKDAYHTFKDLLKAQGPRLGWTK